MILTNQDIENIRKKMIKIAISQWASEEDIESINNLFNEWEEKI